MAKFLIFRTDRIGDYIFSRMLTESIKNDKSSHIIDFVCSTYNSNYVKNFKDINKIYFPDQYGGHLTPYGNKIVAETLFKKKLF